MKISDKTREEAAVLLSMAACNHCPVQVAAVDCGATRSAYALALRAYYDDSVPCQFPSHATYAAAEQLLRTGWSP